MASGFLPFMGKLLVFAVAFAAAIAFYSGYIFNKGVIHERNANAVKQANLLIEERDRTQKLAESITENALKAKQERDEIVAKHEKELKALKSMLAAARQYRECEHSDEVFNKIRGAVKK